VAASLAEASSVARASRVGSTPTFGTKTGRHAATSRDRSAKTLSQNQLAHGACVQAFLASWDHGGTRGETSDSGSYHLDRFASGSLTAVLALGAHAKIIVLYGIESPVLDRLHEIEVLSCGRGSTRPSRSATSTAGTQPSVARRCRNGRRTRSRAGARSAA
jgi:hypothetical protein